MNNTWKQPIPVGLDQEFNNDYAAVAMYMMLIYRASNDTRIVRIPYATREATVTIKRGQCLFSRRQFALYLGWSEKKCERVLKDLSDFYGKVTHERTSNITLVTLLNYDSLVTFDPRVDSERTTKGQRADSEDTNLRVLESVQTGKSEKIVECITVENPPSSLSDIFQKLLSGDQEATRELTSPFSTLTEEVLTQLIVGFVGYWTEPTPSGKKQRWQMEKTFEVRRRFATWVRNAEKFGEIITTRRKGAKWGDMVRKD